MKRFLLFFFIVLTALTGLVSVPRCYVLRPDCPERGSFRCPYMGDTTTRSAEEKSAGRCCAMASETAQQDAPPPLPGGKAVQFKVEQYLQLSELHIAPPAESALSGGFFTACHSVALFQPDFFHMLAFVHPPPFPLLLQKQSFLI